MSSTEIKSYFVNTPLGVLTAKLKADQLTYLQFEDQNEMVDSENLPEIIQKLIEELDFYFKGELRTFSIPLNPEGTVFQKEVWEEIANINIGQTITYKALSERMEQPLAIRAIATANGANPIAILIPCHRIIGSDGSLTGYAWGLERKRHLLQLEMAFSETKDLFS